MSAAPLRSIADPADRQTVAITHSLEDRVCALEAQLQDVDSELRRRFGDESYSVDRAEQARGALERLRWAISRSPVVSPLMGDERDN